MVEQHKHAHAASRLQGVIVGLVREVYGETAIERCARYDGDRFPEQVPTPLEALWAANWLLQRVSREVQLHVRRAREAGHSWAQIGHAVDTKPDGGRSVAETAYEHFAGSPASWSVNGPSFVWRCPSCGRVISDRGPYEGHPADNQPGHTAHCARLDDEISRWRSSWDDNDTVNTDE